MAARSSARGTAPDYIACTCVGIQIHVSLKYVADWQNMYGAQIKTCVFLIRLGHVIHFIRPTGVGVWNNVSISRMYKSRLEALTYSGNVLEIISGCV